MLKLLKRLRKYRKECDMAKNERKKGKSARNGNAPAPYTKYEKRPYQYSAAYYDWHRRAKAGRAHEVVKEKVERPQKQQFLMAAE